MNHFTALADPTRLSIVEMLASHGHLSATDISRRFTMSAPAISQHLKVLREAKLVRMQPRAQQRIYSVDPVGIQAMEQWVQKMQAFWNDRFDALDDYLKNNPDTPSPSRKKRGKHAKI